MRYKRAKFVAAYKQTTITKQYGTLGLDLILAKMETTVHEMIYTRKQSERKEMHAQFVKLLAFVQDAANIAIRNETRARLSKGG